MWGGGAMDDVERVAGLMGGSVTRAQRLSDEVQTSFPRRGSMPSVAEIAAAIEDYRMKKELDYWRKRVSGFCPG